MSIKYNVMIQKEEEWYVAKCLDNNVASQGKTIEEALENLREAFKLKNGEEYENYSEWLGVKELDLTKFDIEDMNFRVKKIPRIYADIYEYQLEPTEQSMKILNRDYLKKK